MGKFKWFGAVLAAVSLVLIAVTLEGGTALGRQAAPSQPPLIVPVSALALPPGGTDVLDIELCIDNIIVDTNSKGNSCFTGQGTFVRQDPTLVLGKEVIEVELVSMSLIGTVVGKVATYTAGAGLGSGLDLAASLGTIGEPTAGAGCTPCDVELEVFFEIQCGTPQGDESCCDIAPTCAALKNCGVGGDIFTGTTLVIPALGVFNAANSSACLNATERATGENLVATVSVPAVGGIAERLGTSAGPDSSLDSSSGSGFNYAALGGALAGAAVAVAAGGWYARRRWLT